MPEGATVAELAQIKPFDLWDFMAGHVQLTVSDLFSVLHINGRDFYFYSTGSAHELGAFDGTGAGCSPCCKEAQAAHEAGRVTREAGGQPCVADREEELIKEAGLDEPAVRDSI